MAYRRTKQYQERTQRRLRAMQEGRARARMDREPARLWEPPDLRRRITIEDFDGTQPKVHVIELHRTPRIDSYRAVVDGTEWKARIGWARVLDGLRKALPRLASPRHATD